MMYTKEKAEELRNRYNLAKVTLYKWAAKGQIPDDYDDPNFGQGRKRSAAYEHIERVLRAVFSQRDPLLYPAGLKHHLKNQARLDRLNKAWRNIQRRDDLDNTPLTQFEAEAIAGDLNRLMWQLLDLMVLAEENPFDAPTYTSKLRELLQMPLVNCSAIVRHLGAQESDSAPNRLRSIACGSTRLVDEDLLTSLTAVLRPLQLILQRIIV